MKKLLLLFVITISFSCSDDDSSSVSPNSINPPDWIQGTWVMEESSNAGFKFTSGDLCIMFSGMYTCNKQSLELYNGTNVSTNVDEEISDSRYKADISIQGSTTVYEFVKISTNRIECLSPIAGAIYIKQ